MTAPLALWHCRSCGVEWSHPVLLPCWLCGGVGRAGQDSATPWTARAKFEAQRAAQELAS